jgi:hypothetical protein
VKELENRVKKLKDRNKTIHKNGNSNILSASSKTNRK